MAGGDEAGGSKNAMLNPRIPGADVIGQPDEARSESLCSMLDKHHGIDSPSPSHSH